MVAEQLDDTRFEELYEIGVDEISYRRQHHYLTLVANHRTGKVIWADEGRDAATLERFFNELGAERTAKLHKISVDMAPSWRKAIDARAPQAVVCYDPYLVVASANRALDVVRREHWNVLRARAGPHDARRFKHARWALLKRPDDLTDTQADQLTALRRAAGAVWRAYRLKETLWTVFDRELRHTDVSHFFDRWCAWGAPQPPPVVHHAGPHHPPPPRRHPRGHRLQPHQRAARGPEQPSHP